MPSAFTVDRAGSLRAGIVLERTRHVDIEPPQLQAHVDDLFPDGVTEHGNGYFLAGNQPAQGVSAAIELIFEYVRRARFPDAPSRFESVFACQSLQQAREFKAAFGGVGAIWEVESEAPGYKADMRCLTVAGTVLVASWRADLYWSGLDSATGLPSLWELLLEPPVRVVQKVEPR